MLFCSFLPAVSIRTGTKTSCSLNEKKRSMLYPAIKAAKTRVEGNKIPRHEKEKNEMKQILEKGPAGGRVIKTRKCVRGRLLKGNRPCELGKWSPSGHLTRKLVDVSSYLGEPALFKAVIVFACGGLMTSRFSSRAFGP